MTLSLIIYIREHVKLQSYVFIFIIFTQMTATKVLLWTATLKFEYNWIQPQQPLCNFGKAPREGAKHVRCVLVTRVSSSGLTTAFISTDLSWTCSVTSDLCCTLYVFTMRGTGNAISGVSKLSLLLSWSSGSYTGQRNTGITTCISRIILTIKKEEG